MCSLEWDPSAAVTVWLGIVIGCRLQRWTATWSCRLWTLVEMYRRLTSICRWAVVVGDCSIHAQETAPIRLSNSSPKYHNGVLNMEDVHSISHVATLFHRIHTVHQPIHLLMTCRTFAEDLSNWTCVTVQSSARVVRLLVWPNSIKPPVCVGQMSLPIVTATQPAITIYQGAYLLRWWTARSGLAMFKERHTKVSNKSYHSREMATPESVDIFIYHIIHIFIRLYVLSLLLGNIYSYVLVR
jgi:hypothetical protein